MAPAPLISLWWRYCAAVTRLASGHCHAVDRVALWAAGAAFVCCLLELLLHGVPPLAWPEAAVWAHTLTVPPLLVGTLVWITMPVVLFLATRPYAFALQVYGPEAVGRKARPAHEVHLDRVFELLRSGYN